MSTSCSLNCDGKDTTTTVNKAGSSTYLSLSLHAALRGLFNQICKESDFCSFVSFFAFLFSSERMAAAAACEVFLGGSCNPTTWRTDIAIPTLKSLGITYYNPVSPLSTYQYNPQYLPSDSARELRHPGCLLLHRHRTHPDDAQFFSLFSRIEIAAGVTLRVINNLGRVILYLVDSAGGITVPNLIRSKCRSGARN